MPVKQTTLNRMLSTMLAVVHSPRVNRFRIGYSKQSIVQRGGAYRYTGWPHIVAVSDRMCRKDALDLEKFLHGEMQSDKRGVLYRKYGKTVRDDVYRRSSGGAIDGQDDEPIHGVYLAWAEIPLE